jgi:hypothetical protein
MNEGIICFTNNKYKDFKENYIRKAKCSTYNGKGEHFKISGE